MLQNQLCQHKGTYVPEAFATGAEQSALALLKIATESHFIGIAYFLGTPS